MDCTVLKINVLNTIAASHYNDNALAALVWDQDSKISKTE